MLTVLISIVVTQFLVITALLASNFRLRQRPDFAVFQALHEKAKKSEDAAAGATKALLELKNSQASGQYILDSKKAIDADRITAILASAMERGEGIAGYEVNVQGLLIATNGELEDYPDHFNQLYYADKSKIALWRGNPKKMPKSLENLIGD